MRFRVLLQYGLVRVRLLSDGVQTFVSPFVGRFTGDVFLAAVRALKGPEPKKSLLCILEGENVELYIDDLPVPLRDGQGFAAVILRDTLRGMVRNLKGIHPDHEIRMEVEMD